MFTEKRKNKSHKKKHKKNMKKVKGKKENGMKLKNRRNKKMENKIHQHLPLSREGKGGQCSVIFWY